MFCDRNACGTASDCDDCYKFGLLCAGLPESKSPMGCYVSQIEATESPAPSGQAEFALLTDLLRVCEEACIFGCDTKRNGDKMTNEEQGEW